jgi:uncharacterized protein YndB with AHSA1/START domain
MGKWWLKSNSIGSSPLMDVIIEPRAGGRWFERGEDGSECVWGKVIAWDPPNRIVLAWQLNGEWRYDAGLITELEIQFLAAGENATQVELEHRNLERYGDKAEAMAAALGSDSGWPGLLERYAGQLKSG